MADASHSEKPGYAAGAASAPASAETLQLQELQRKNAELLARLHDMEDERDMQQQLDAARQKQVLKSLDTKLDDIVCMIKVCNAGQQAFDPDCLQAILGCLTEEFEQVITAMSDDAIKLQSKFTEVQQALHQEKMESLDRAHVTTAAILDLLDKKVRECMILQSRINTTEVERLREMAKLRLELAMKTFKTQQLQESMQRMRKEKPAVGVNAELLASHDLLDDMQRRLLHLEGCLQTTQLERDMLQAQIEKFSGQILDLQQDGSNARMRVWEQFVQRQNPQVISASLISQLQSLQEANLDLKKELKSRTDEYNRQMHAVNDAMAKLRPKDVQRDQHVGELEDELKSVQKQLQKMRELNQTMVQQNREFKAAQGTEQLKLQNRIAQLTKELGTQRELLAKNQHGHAKKIKDMRQKIEHMTICAADVSKAIYQIHAELEQTRQQQEQTRLEQEQQAAKLDCSADHRKKLQTLMDDMVHNHVQLTQELTQQQHLTQELMQKLTQEQECTQVLKQQHTKEQERMRQLTQKLTTDIGLLKSLHIEERKKHEAKLTAVFESVEAVSEAMEQVKAERPTRTQDEAGEQNFNPVIAHQQGLWIGYQQAACDMLTYLPPQLNFALQNAPPEMWPERILEVMNHVRQVAYAWHAGQWSFGNH